MVAALVMAVKYMLAPQFTATSAVLIEPDQSPIEKRDATSDYRGTDSAEVESQVEIMHSPRLLQAMLQQKGTREALLRACLYSRNHSSLGFIASYVDTARQFAGISGKAMSCDVDGPAAIEAVGKNFSIYQVGRSRVVSVNFQSSLPDTAALVVNSLVSVYLADNVEAKSKARLTTSKWLEEEGSKLRQSLVQKEEQIDRYRREHGLLRGQQGLVTQENLSGLIAQVGAAKARLAETAARYDEVRAAERNGTNLATIPVVLNSNTIRDLRAREAALRSQVSLLTTQYGDRYPKVVAAKNELHDLRTALSAEVGRIVKSLEAEVASARSNEQALTATLNKAKLEAGSAADADSAVQGLVRDADIDRRLYFVLASRAKELETETRAQNPNAWLVNLAETPVRPSFPRALPFMGVALLLGVIGGTGAAFARDYADKTLRNIDDFVDDVEVPVLARIPAERGLARRGGFMAAVSDDRSRFREAIRALYAHVLLRDNVRTILVTSSAPREGKTSVSVALAHFAAAAGSRVLLIEADLRMPVFAQMMPLRGGGLERYFNSPSLEDALIEAPYDDVPHFHVLPAGYPAQNSTELLSSTRMASLLRYARERYDFVVIDTPPAGYLMDACMLARRTDGVIFVAKWGQSQPDIMRNTMRTIKEAGGSIIGSVIGMVEFRTYSTYGNRIPIAKHAYMKQ
jgi:capsular exopolysaccharide synthesis family protein